MPRFDLCRCLAHDVLHREGRWLLPGQIPVAAEVATSVPALRLSLLLLCLVLAGLFLILSRARDVGVNVYDHSFPLLCGGGLGEQDMMSC